MERDPRQIGPELSFVQMSSTDPRRRHLEWRDLLARCGIRRAEPARERVLLAFRSTVESISSIAEADEFLEREEEGWLSFQNKGSHLYPLIKMFEKKEPPIESPEELAKAVRPAIGF